MPNIIRLIIRVLLADRSALIAENLALQQQLAVLGRSAKRPRLRQPSMANNRRGELEIGHWPRMDFSGGTALEEDKRHVTFPGGHSSLGWMDHLIHESLDWLDRHLGEPLPAT